MIMKISIGRYHQLQLGHNTLTKRYDQNNKAPKIKRHTRAQKHPQSILHMNDSLHQHACPPHTPNNSTHAHTSVIDWAQRTNDLSGDDKKVGISLYASDHVGVMVMLKCRDDGDDEM